MHRLGIWTAAAFLALALLGAGCKSALNKKGDGESCTTHTECKSGLVCDCSTRTCRPEGLADVRCALPDGGWPDSTIPDAAPAVDAAVTDGEIVDGTATDGDVVDGDTVDAEVVDAETVDASP